MLNKSLTKLNLISTMDIWLDMRGIRNRIVHDYIPEKIAEMYQLIRGEFYDEFTQLIEKTEKLTIE